MGALHVHFLLIVLLPNELLTIPSSRPWKQDILCSNRRGTTAKGIVLGSLWEVAEEIALEFEERTPTDRDGSGRTAAAETL